MKRCLAFFSSVFLVCVLFSNAIAQDTHISRATKFQPMAENSLYVELGGNGFVYSLNYDRMIAEDVSVRFGFEYFSLSAKDTNSESETNGAGVKIGSYFIPATLNFFVTSHDNGRAGSSKLEIGAGPLILFVTGTGTGTLAGKSVSGSVIGATGTVGYRYQPYDGGFVFRIGFTPIYFRDWLGLLPFAGISVGYAF